MGLCDIDIDIDTDRAVVAEPGGCDDDDDVLAATSRAEHWPMRWRARATSQCAYSDTRTGPLAPNSVRFPPRPPASSRSEAGDEGEGGRGREGAETPRTRLLISRARCDVMVWMWASWP